MSVIMTFVIESAQLSIFTQPVFEISHYLVTSHKLFISIITVRHTILCSVFINAVKRITLSMSLHSQLHSLYDYHSYRSSPGVYFGIFTCLFIKLPPYIVSDKLHA